MINEKMIIEDLGLKLRFEKGKDISVRNCWHFCTDGNAVNLMFYDQEDFILAMNRIYIVRQKVECCILAFCLMNNHLHFILYGSFEECNCFIRDYIKRTSMFLRYKYGKENYLHGLPVNYQVIDTQRYLKTAICYVLKNPVEAGLPYTFYDYPWSSAPLYFRAINEWSSPNFYGQSGKWPKNRMSRDECRKLFRCDTIDKSTIMIGPIVFPKEYVEVNIVEMLFRTTRGYMYYICRSSESDIESIDGYISKLTLPDNELILYRRDLSRKYYAQENIRLLNTEQRLKLCRMLLSNFNCSKKQVVRICGLKFDEVKNILS